MQRSERYTNQRLALMTVTLIETLGRVFLLSIASIMKDGGANMLGIVCHNQADDGHTERDANKSEERKQRDCK